MLGIILYGVCAVVGLFVLLPLMMGTISFVMSYCHLAGQQRFYETLMQQEKGKKKDGEQR